MRNRIIRRNRLIVVRPASRDVSRIHQRRTHEAMTDHERHCRPLLLGKGQELRRKFAHYVAVECYKLRDPEAVKD